MKQAFKISVCVLSYMAFIWVIFCPFITWSEKHFSAWLNR